MATVTRSDFMPEGLLRAPALLASGDRMSQPEFHRRYEQYPDDVRFELINGIVRSKAFPGLWIDTQALFRGDLNRMVRVLNDGLASPEHERFVRRLAKAAAAKAKAKKRRRNQGE